MKKILLKRGNNLIPDVGVHESWWPVVKKTRVFLVVLDVISIFFIFLGPFQSIFLSLFLLFLILFVGSFKVIKYSVSNIIYVNCKHEGCGQRIVVRDLSTKRTTDEMSFNKDNLRSSAKLTCRNGHTDTYTKKELKETKQGWRFWPWRSTEEDRIERNKFKSFGNFWRYLVYKINRS